MFTMSTSSQNYHHGDLRAALLNEGAALVAESGPQGLTLRKLAQRLGVSHMAPYRHFEDKDALLAAIAADGFQQLKACLEFAEKAGSASKTPLLREGVAYVVFALDQPALFRLMFGAGRPAGQYAELDASRAEAFGVLLRQIPGKAAKAKRESDAETAERQARARGCWALVHGLALLLLDGLLQMPGGVNTEEWIAEIVGGTVSSTH